MAQYYEAVVRQELGDEDVLNTLWYRRDSAGVPNTLDQLRLAEHLQAFYIPLAAGILTDSLKFRDITVYSYADTWVRTPFLSTVLPTPGTGDLVSASTPGVVALIMGFRVEPVVPDPTTFKPVRRGYLAYAGMPESQDFFSGAWDTAYLTGAPMNSLVAWLKSSFVLPTAAEPMVPIRVSKPPLNVSARGYGLIAQAIPRIDVSTRRSRKRGKGS